MDGTVIEIPAAPESVVLRLYDVHGTQIGQHRAHLLSGNKAFVVERYEKEPCVEGPEKVFQERKGSGSHVVSGALPVGGDSGDLADAAGTLVPQEEVEHEIVRAVGMLVVRRIDVHKVQIFQTTCNGVGIFLQHPIFTLEVAEHRHVEPDLSRDAHQGIGSAAAELADPGLPVLVEALEDSCRVGMNGRAAEQRPQEHVLHFSRQRVHEAAVVVQPPCIALRVEDTVFSGDALFVLGRVQFFDEARRKVLGIHPLVQIGDGFGDRRKVNFAPVTQVAARSCGGVLLDVVADQQVGMRFEISRNHAGAAEGVENTETCLSKTMLDLFDCGGDVSEEGTLVADVGDY